ncbi:NUDIX domain-containing protein [Salinisphaera sp. Q1T1-3]|uniref:NUDIX domain-containing protein n=1 Tax=Salinisphaera sp. Q1T1-3 TaxID=2321229 RepID=UPI000E723B24|nr:NUDIX domain-containing protein [Salinisphaera sp. Q1T1-3]RJS93771.1 NUDIX domain-containing protein [Salinisphaera sp. Q1T1-3]
MDDRRRYCPVCATPLMTKRLSGIDRRVCGDPGCGFVFWDNPIPVVAGIVEHEGQLVFARNVRWPKGMYGVVTGFLEPREEPRDAVVREVAEELGLAAEITEFIGVYGFARKNQILLAYHLVGHGEITLPDGELAEYFHVDKACAQYWPGGTGLAVRDWLQRQGFDPQPRQLPPEVEAWLKAPPELD